MRVKQQQGLRGSLKWIQRAVNEGWPVLDQTIIQRIDAPITWLSPLTRDDFAEYRDGSFLKLIGQPELEPELKAFWPARGPQWDALGRSSKGDVLLVEAKAHIGEMCSPATAASPQSRERIAVALDRVAEHLNADPGRAPWTDFFYQIANRLAHLHFLRSHGVRAWLILVNFLHDEDVNGPTTPETWRAAYQVALHVMGLRQDHPYSPFIVHVYPDVREA